MSRHRNVRNLDYDEILDDEAAEDTMTPQESDRLDAAVEQITQTLGNNFSLQEVKDAAWYYYFDVEKSTNYLLDQMTKRQETTKKTKISQNSGMSSLEPEVSCSSAPKEAVAVVDKVSKSKEVLDDSEIPADAVLNPPKKLTKLQQLAQAKAEAKRTAAVKTAQDKAQVPAHNRESSGVRAGPSLQSSSSTGNDFNTISKPAIVSTTYGSDLLEEQFQKVDEPITRVQEVRLATPSDYARVVFGAHGTSDIYRYFADQGFSCFTGSSAQSIPNAQKAFSNPSPDDKVQKAQAASKGLSKDIPAKHKITALEPSQIQVTERQSQKVANKARTGRNANLDARQYVSFVVVGHVDAGKSTLFGRLLYDLGNIDERSMQKLRTESSKMQKSSFAFAWAMDSSVEERERGVTIDIATNTFDVQNTTFTILDAPGHKDFVPNMIAGASQADFAVLVIDASRGAFESGFDASGQTKEHAVLIRSLGIQKIIVAINKLDNVQWSQERFKDIKVQLSTFLTHSGFSPNDLSFVPCSGLTGANVAIKVDDDAARWYNGKALVQEMSSMPMNLRDEKGPFRLIISDIQASPNSSNITVIGRISSGELQVTDTVVCLPSNEKAVMKSLTTGDTIDQAFAGDNVIITLSDIDPVHLRIGDVLCHTTEPVQNSNLFETQMITFQLKRPLLSGSSVVLHRGRADVAAVIKKIQVVDKAKGGFRSSRHVLGGGQARMTIQLVNSVLPLEVFSDNKDLGRIILRREGETVAAGVVIALL